MSVTKEDLIHGLRSSLGLTKKDASLFLESFLEEMKYQLENNEPINLQGFGTFNLRSKDSRVGRNPKTGESATISARKVVAFKAGKALKAKPILESE